MSQFVYHFKTDQMIGQNLYPLNELQNMYPDIYQLQSAKYWGREKLIQKKIPLLNCLWNDVLHLSPIHPQIILNYWKSAGLYDYTKLNKPISVYKIPLQLIQQEQTIYFKSQNFNFNNFDPALEKYWAFEKSEYCEQTEIENTQKEIWHLDHKNNRKLFWYSHTLHVLAKQSIDVSSCEVIDCH